MRVLITAHIPTNEASAKAFKESPAATMAAIEAYIKLSHAEAAYFGEKDGNRTAYFLADLPSADMIPVMAEPLFINMGATVNIQPVMTFEEVKRGLSKVKL
jgi:hypothetical protein